MAKRRAKRVSTRIKGLFSHELADGTVTYYWKASPTQRKAGYKGMDLGTVRVAAMLAAEARNDEIALAKAAPALPVAPKAAPATKVYSFGDLAHVYRRDLDHRATLPKANKNSVSQSTRKEYRSRLKWLVEWADDGELALSKLTPELCVALRDTLVENESEWNAAAKLRVLRLVLGWACKPQKIDGRSVTLLKANPASALDVPEPEPRTKCVAFEALHWLAEKGGQAVGPSMGLALLLGFYTVQREADLLASTVFNWREVHDVAAIDRAALAGPDGRIMGLRLRQQKTDTPIAVFVPPDVAARVTAELAARGADYSGPLLLEQDRGDLRHWPDWQFQRDYLVAREAAIEAARKEGDNWIVDQLTGLKFADLRRSGMCWLRDGGATVAQIASISGHSIEYTTKILKTYLPADTRASAAGMAHVLRNTAGTVDQQRAG